MAEGGGGRGRGAGGVQATDLQLLQQTRRGRCGRVLAEGRHRYRGDRRGRVMAATTTTTTAASDTTRSSSTTNDGGRRAECGVGEEGGRAASPGGCVRHGGEGLWEGEARQRVEGV